MKSPIDSIIEESYTPVFLYCIYQLNGDISGAEDCTQEVFLLLCKHVNKLDMTKSILPWLFRTADHVMQSYRRKNPVHEGLDKANDLIDNSLIQDSILDTLTEDERILVQTYYNGEDKSEIARKRGISVTALYKQIARIKQKLRKLLDI